MERSLIVTRPALKRLSADRSNHGATLSALTHAPHKTCPSEPSTVTPSYSAKGFGLPKVSCLPKFPNCSSSITGHVVTWTNRAGKVRSVFFADAGKAQRCADIKRKLGLACTVAPSAERLKFSKLMRVNV